MNKVCSSGVDYRSGRRGDRHSCRWLPRLQKNPSCKQVNHCHARQLAAAAASSRLSSVAASQEFEELAEISGTGLGSIEARPTATQRGLVTTAAVEKGETLIKVPLSVRYKPVPCSFRTIRSSNCKMPPICGPSAQAT